MKGYSLHVGVGYVGFKEHQKADAEKQGIVVRYNNLDKESPGSEKDANSMRTIFTKANDSQKLGLDPYILLSSDGTATSDNFKSKLEHIIQKTKEDTNESYVLITFSGHGAHYENRKKSVNRVEFLCFQDRMVLEHEIKIMLLQFPARVDCVLVLDSCNSGGIAHVSTEKGINKTGNDLKTLSKRNTIKVVESNKNKEFYSNLIKTTPSVSNHADFQSNILFLAACASFANTTISTSKTENSAFTMQVVDLWNNGRFNGKYHDFYLGLTHRLGYPETSGPVISGAYKEVFLDRVPFKIK